MNIFVTDAQGTTHQVPAFEDWQIMELIRDAGIKILANCGGCCACATCHVYVAPEWQDKLDAMQAEERDMLDTSFNVQNSSRLSCQLRFTKALDGLQLTLAPGSY